jgi:uncharacterized protein
MNRFVRTALLVALALGALLVWLSLRSFSLNPGSLAGVVDRLSNFTTVFLGIFIEAVPFLLIGTLASGLVEAFVNQDDLSRLVPHDPIRGVLMGGMMGFIFPVCECGVVPLVRRLFKKGLPLPVGITFLLAAPAFNPIVLASTLAAFGFGRVLFLRMGLTLIIAMSTGLVFAAQRRPERLVRPAALAVPSGASGLPAAEAAFVRPPFRQGMARALSVAADEFFEMGRYLIAGGLLATLMQIFIPQSALITVSAGPVLSVLTLILLAVVLSVCSTVDAFIALAFTGTFTTGSILAFLVFGPMVDIKSTLMFLGVFRRRTVVYLILLPLMMTILLTVAINLNTVW